MRRIAPIGSSLQTLVVRVEEEFLLADAATRGTPAGGPAAAAVVDWLAAETARTMAREPHAL